MKSPRHGELSWSELPPELLRAVAERLETRTDILHFRRVCKTWRASTPLSLISSKSILSPLLPYKFTNKAYTKVLAPNSVFLIRPLRGPTQTNPSWVFTGEELFRGSLTVRHPLSRDFVEPFLLPSRFPDKLDLSDYHVLELGNALAVWNQKRLERAEVSSMFRISYTFGDVPSVYA